MKSATVYALMIFLHLGTNVMSNEIKTSSLTDKPELAIPEINAQIKELFGMQQNLEKVTSFDEKLEIVSNLPDVKKFFDENRGLEDVLQDFPTQYKYVVKAAVALHQGPVIFYGWQNIKDLPTAMQQLVDNLWATERFYDYMGGIAGYHVKTLQLISDQLAKKSEPESAKLLLPPTTDIRQDSVARRKMVADGISSINNMAEIYVVGGAGDRLALVDETTKTPLPVARLNFAGHCLLENLVRDLEAREYLAYKLSAKQSITPIVLMTSHEKRNDAQIAAILEERAYFGRPKESIFRLLQPLIPVIAIDGKWAVSGPCELILKPGGHGVIWKLADEYAALDWLEKHDRSYCIVRQINNPIAGLDANLLSLSGFWK